MALYYNDKDTKGSTNADPKSNCTGDCLSTWTVFDQAQVIAPSALKPNDFKEFTRQDGTPQLSYKGMPLYTYSEDSNSGDTKGDNVDNSWHLVKP